MKLTNLGLIILISLPACVNKSHNETSNDDIDTTIVPGGTSTDAIQTGKLISKVYCATDPSQSYAVYIPAKSKDDALPVVYFFDPHGDGSFPLGKYKALAEAYNFILIGSNNSKNGNDWPATENIWQTMFDDTKKRLKINSSLIYTCGFSGGAKVAAYIALHHNETRGVIANGAGLPDGTPAGNFNFSFTAITGEGDMNMTDLVGINNELDKTQTRHRILFFNGKHEWAPESTMNIAFAGLQLDAMREKQIPANDRIITSFSESCKKRVADYLAAKNYILAARECRLSFNILDGLTTEVNWFKEKEASITNDPAYQKELKTQQTLLATEQNLKALYSQQFQNGDINYWTKTINDLQIKAKAPTAGGGMYQRLLAYLSLAFYSISNRFVNGNENNEAQYFVSLYKLADATNSEAWYLSAILNARNNSAKATEEDLIKAASFGFKDKNRMAQQPEFQKLAGQINFAQIESKMDGK
jgi:predicted esterase